MNAEALFYQKWKIELTSQDDNRKASGLNMTQNILPHKMLY